MEAHPSTGVSHTLNDRLNAIARLSLGLSHELNNDLGAIQSNVGIMRKRLEDDSPLLRNLHHIAGSGDHISELSRILQIYTQRGRPENRMLNLAALTGQIVRSFRAGIPPSCRLRLRQRRDRLPVMVCPALLESAILALLQNALDALKGEPGTIQIETASAGDPMSIEAGWAFGDLPEEPGARIDITDNGEGMNPDVQQHMLEPFFSTRIRARGLGMAFVVGLVFHCNAALHVHSAPGEGTRMRLWFPATDG